VSLGSKPPDLAAGGSGAWTWRHSGNTKRGIGVVGYTCEMGYDGFAGPAVSLFTAAVESVTKAAAKKQASQANYFTAVVGSVHSEFLLFQEQHRSTFDQIRKMIADPSVSLKEVRRHIEANEAREGTWLAFDQYDRLGDKFTSLAAREAFHLYSGTLKKCLEVTYSGPPTVQYYSCLSQQLDREIADLARRGEGESGYREDFIDALNRTHKEFNKFCSTVQAAYLQLKAEVLT
jgi:hypothetical protein